MAANAGKSIEDAVAFGQKLTMLFQTWVDVSRRLRSYRLKPVLADILATSSVLQQLKGLVDMNQLTDLGQPAAEALTQTGLQEIETLAVKSDMLYKIIMLLLQDAADRNEESSTKDNKATEDLKARLLKGPVPDPSSLQTIGVIQRTWDSEDWLNMRLERCDEQLKWLKQKLFIMLHMTKLARLQISSVERQDGTFEQELQGRIMVHNMRNGSVKYTQKKARKQEKAQRQWKLQAKSNDTDASSIASSACSDKSGTTTSTAVDGQRASKEESTLVRNHAEQAGQEKKYISLSQGAPVSKPSFDVVVKQDSATQEKQGLLNEGTAESKQLDTIATHTPAKAECSFSCSIYLDMKLPESITDWTHRIFGKDDVFKKDRESKDLEAYIYESPVGYTPNRQARKIPFGHRRLHYGLSQVLKDKDKIGSTWHRYIDLGPTNRWVVDELAREANKTQTRERVCIALQEIDKSGKDPAMLVFFSIREEKQPISLKDPSGRTYKVPFERCRAMDGLKAAIKEVFNYTPEIGPHVMEGHYDLVNSKGDILLPGLWKDTIKPGERVTMMMWPMSTPLLGFYNFPPYCPTVPPGLNPRAEAQFQSMMRMRRIAQNTAINGPPPGMGPVPPPFGVPAPMPMRPPMPPMMTGPPPPVIRRSRSFSTSSISKSSINEDAISEEENKQLTVIDFVEEQEKDQTVTMVDLLNRFTNLKDTLSQDRLDGFLTDGAYDSDCSDSSTSTSSSILVD